MISQFDFTVSSLNRSCGRRLLFPECPSKHDILGENEQAKDLSE